MNLVIVVALTSASRDRVGYPSGYTKAEVRLLYTIISADP